MKHKITKNLNRLDLHDSSFTDYKFDENDLILNFNWAKIDNYEEEKLGVLVLGSCELRLRGIRENFLEEEPDTIMKRVTFPVHFPYSLDLVLQNDSSNDRELNLAGLMRVEGHDYSSWVVWHLEFNDFEFLWDNHVTFEAWEQGETPEKRPLRHNKRNTTS